MFEISIREDIFSPWYDVSHEGEHWASFKSRKEAQAYINGAEGEPMSDTLGPCGCVDYHWADCTLVAG